MSLEDAESAKKIKIKDIQSGIELKRKLNTIGIRVDDFVIKLNNNNWGPVLIQNISNGSSKLALGRELAGKIIVEYGE